MKTHFALVWHVARKDLYRGRVPLALWALSGTYLAVSPLVTVAAGSWGDYLGIFALLMFLPLMLMLTASIVQEDGPMESTVFWRTRPISPAKLLAAKLGVLGALFVVVPVLVHGALVFAGVVSVQRSSTVPQMITMLTCVLLGGVAVAACTKDLVRFFLTGLVALLATGFLGAFLQRIGPAPSLASHRGNGDSKLFAMVIFWAFCSVAIIYLQYFKRARWLSFALIGLAVVGASLIGSFWTWRFIH